MSFDWAAFNAVAQELIESPGLDSDYEARCRSAISRSYYAAFGASFSYLVATGEQIRRYEAHQEVWQALDRRSDERHKSVARRLNRLRQLRNAADYDPVPAETIDSCMALDCHEWASDILTILAELWSTGT